MRRYTSAHELAVSASANTVTPYLSFVTGANSIGQIYEIACGPDPATPVDASLVAAFDMASAASNGTGQTPRPLDQLEGAANMVVTTAPTGVTLAVALPIAMWSIGFNSRVTVRWVAPEPDACLHLKAALTISTAGIMYAQQPGTATCTLRNVVFFKE